ncbi:MAG: L-aspartate oxidase [Hyphomicrobiales bacterium]
MNHDNVIDTSDVLIIGAGLAGLFTALKLAPRLCCVVDGAPIGAGGSSGWAQGGIAAAVMPGDTPQAHAEDTIMAGAGLVDSDVALAMAREAPGRIEDLLRLGVPFDRDLEGKLAAGREGAHGHNRIIHVRGDQAGKAIMQALIRAVRATPSIRIIGGHSAYEFAMEQGRIVGVFARPAEAGASAAAPLLIKARAVVLATGGAGQLFAVTTNPLRARGEGLGMAARAGAMIADPEFVQFHPTAILCDRDPAPLATEALRGRGAVLVDERGRRFMSAVHEDGELAPRDVVARAIFRLYHSGHKVFLDATKAVGKTFPDDFATVYENCRSLGIDPINESIPVIPAAHYHMGGVMVDMAGRSSLSGLWACGEVASTGVHGANRLASNSLLEAVVYGARIALDVDAALSQIPACKPRNMLPPVLNGGEAPGAERLEHLRRLMTRYVGVERDDQGMTRALAAIEHLEHAAGVQSLFCNIATAAKLMTACAYAREESRGGHWRRDFPEPRPPFHHRSFITLKEAERIASCAVEAMGEDMTDDKR